MSYAIVYSSPTGNTAMLAQTIREALPQAECCYFGEPDDQALSAKRIYVGFWTDKGTCDEQTARFLERLTDQQVFLFGTAGFGGRGGLFRPDPEPSEGKAGPGGEGHRDLHVPGQDVPGGAPPL